MSKKFMVKMYIVNEEGKKGQILQLPNKIDKVYFAYEKSIRKKPLFFVMYDPNMTAENREKTAEFFTNLGEDIRSIGTEE